jgi:ATP/maltotriose-dependent transcriptional regulator MalT/DNA-binding SARP family transcriptional activator
LKRYVTGDALLRKPTSGAFADCASAGGLACARTPDGHSEAVAPSAMKSRRLICPPRRTTLDARAKRITIPRTGFKRAGFGALADFGRSSERRSPRAALVFDVLSFTIPEREAQPFHIALSARPPALAKLTRPRLHDALARPRLFARLDEAIARPIVWISAPPGSGKTTLVASYLEARGLRHLWYQVDAADSDAATFMHYLRQAALQVAGKRASGLPVFTSEPKQDLARFSRTFCRDLFALLAPRCVIVLDNFHEAESAADQRAAIAQGMEEIPEGINVVVISRTDPPPEFARLAASRSIARVEPSALACTPDEASAMLASDRLDPKAVERIRQQSEGWVAALVLLREHLSRPGAAVDESLGEGKDAIFQYFAGEIFNRAKPENQRVLMLTALPASITPDEAIALTGDADAERALDYLYRRHLFVDRRRGAQTTYQYHALFREFLHDEARRRLSRDEWRDASARAAAMLARRGLASQALDLYRDAGDFDSMRALIHANALEWARQGRAQALCDWIEALPAAMRAADPWLEYWYGRAWIFVEPSRGRPALERAYEAFRRSGDVRGQALALNTIVTGYYYEWANFAPIDRWLPEFGPLLASQALDRESELRARAAYVIGLLFRQPDHPDLDACAKRLDALIDGEPDVNARMMAASTLFNYLNWKDKSETADALVARIEPVLADPAVTPLMQLWWRTHASFWHYINGRYEKSASVIAEARAIAERYGLEAYLFEIDHAETSALISKGDYAAAKAQVGAIERRLSPSRRMDWAYFYNLRAGLEQRLGQHGAAIADAERAVALARETGLPTMQVPHFLARLAHSRIAAGERESGLRTLDEAIELSSGADRRTFEQQRELILSGFDVDAGDNASAENRLRAVLADYRARNQSVFLRQRGDLGSKLADFALEHDIEPDYVRVLIERNGLLAPADAGARWPFRLRVRVLGSFELLRDGVPVRFSGKAQQRPLDLLKLAVALGGRDVDSQQLTSALWPDADGAAAKTSFDSTLFRLRKLLDVDDALTLAGGKLALSRALCWTDVWALDATLAAADSARVDDAHAVARAARRLLEAYRGNLLASDEDAWLAKPRDALRSRFVRALMRLGEALERGEDWAGAIDVYRRGLEADNLAEPLYRGLMRALAASGDRAEALNAFRRCRELFSVVLGLKPSAETERLHREIVAGQRV